MNQFFFFEKEDFLKNGWIYDFVAYIFGFLKSVGIWWCYPLKYVIFLLTLPKFYAVRKYTVKPVKNVRSRFPAFVAFKVKTFLRMQ